MTYLQARLSMETEFSTYNLQYLVLHNTVPDDIYTEIDESAWFIYLRDQTTFMGCNLDWRTATPDVDMSAFTQAMRDNKIIPQETHTDEPVQPDHIIEVIFDKKDSAIAIASKIYTTLLGNKAFQEESMIEVDRLGPTLTFTEAIGGAPTGIPACPTNSLIVKYIDPIWSPIIGPVVLGSVPPIFSVTQIADGIGMVDGGDGAIDERDGWYGYTLAIRGSRSDGQPGGINLTTSNIDADPTAYAYLGSDDPQVDLQTGGVFDESKALAVASSTLDVAMTVDRHRLTTMQATMTLDPQYWQAAFPGAQLRTVTQSKPGGGSWSVVNPKWEEYTRTGFSFSARDGTLVDYVDIAFIDFNGDVIDIDPVASGVNTMRGYFENSSSLCIGQSITIPTGVGAVALKSLRITVAWKASDPSLRESCPVLFDGIWFEHASAQTDLILSWKDGTSKALPVIANPFLPAEAWQSFTLRGLVDTNGDDDYADAGEVRFKGELAGMSITSKAQIDLKQVGLFKTNTSSGSLVETLYLHSFDPYTANTQTFTHSLGVPNAPLPTAAWVTGAGCVASTGVDDFVFVDSWDNNTDGQFDQSLQYRDEDLGPAFAWVLKDLPSEFMSQAGLTIGCSITGTDAAGSSTGTVISIDTDAGTLTVLPTDIGTFRYDMVIDGSSLTITTQLTANPVAVPHLTGQNTQVGHDLDIDGYAEIVVREFTYIREDAAEGSAVEQRVQGTETRVDFNADGLPDYRIIKTSAISSKPHPVQWLTNWSVGSGGAPGYWVHHAWEYLDKSPTYAVQEVVDWNADGFEDYFVTHVDEWPDPVRGTIKDETDPATDHVSNTYDEALTRTYETHYYTRQWVTSDPVRGQVVDSESWTDIDILANRTFVLRDFDGDHLYEDVPCIIFENVRVPFDTRTSLPESQWVDPHGSLYFVDDGTGRFSMAIVFTRQSYNNFVDGERVPVAIGVAIDYDGDHVINTNYRYYNRREPR